MPPRTRPRARRNVNGRAGNNAPKSKQALQKQGFTAPPTATRTGVPMYKHMPAGRVMVSNTEIALDVTGTLASGVIPQGGAIRVFRFDSTATGNNLNTTTWLNGMAKLYDKFIIRKLRLRWVPSVPVTYAGQIAIRWDSDPGKVTTDVGVKAISGDMNATATQVFNAMSLNVLNNQLNRLPQYETFSAAGDTGVGTVGSMNVAYTAITSPTSTATGSLSLGLLWMDYVVEFLNPSASVNA